MPPRHHAFPRLNSPFVEALIENPPPTIEELTALVQTYQPRLMTRLNDIFAEPVTNPPAVIYVIYRLAIDEAAATLHALRELMRLSSNGKAAVILPLPPHLGGLLLGVHPHHLTFTADYHLPPHLAWLRPAHVDDLMPAEVLQRLQNIEAIVLEGILEPSTLGVRRSVGRLLQMLNRCELRLYVHPLPHVPHHVEWVTVDVDLSAIIPLF